MDKNYISFEDAINSINIDNTILKRRDNNILLSDYQIGVLQRNGINYSKYSNVRNLLFNIEEILNDYFDDELDLVSAQLGEFIYYNDTNK
ncbi:MAG: hypothetical protein IJO57_03990 [Bacilli bacterium]|nr:hypothetical protein [Bacilli bacterium]